MSEKSLLILLIVLVLAGPVMGFLLEHRGSQNGHRHVNHAIAGIVVIGLLVLAFVRTNVLSDFYHAFDSRDGHRVVAVETAPAYGHRAHRAHPRKAASRVAEEPSQQKPAARKRIWDSL